MAQFKKFTTKELIEYIKQFKWTRKISQWHVHHTWEPSYDNFIGSNHESLQQSMKNYHVNTKGWSDIGQNLTLFPDGIWLLGRDLNKTPASILGWNTGALAAEMVGNFDKGKDGMSDEQKQAIYEVSEFLVENFGLVMKFHRDSPTAYKTCPGSGIDRSIFFKEVSNFTENKQAAEASRKKAEELRKIMDSVKIVFKDMIKDGKVHYANDYVNNLAEKKVIKGYEDGTFRPDNNMTRAEMAIVVVKAMESLEELIEAKINALTKASRI